MTIPTATSTPCESHPIEIDISTFTPADFQSLKHDDPFLYYSIPSVRRAEMWNLAEPLSDGSLLSNSASILEGDGTTTSTTTTITRRTRVSFECHTDLLLFDDLMGDEYDDEYDELELDNELFKLLGAVYERQQ